ncbi:MAG: hypothetical protein C4530_24160 [Desulfobacteraceae bacterium]|nr:MAG: hypothetical protein C4530_24160 [Desulfobacteraceae bacterium]
MRKTKTTLLLLSAGLFLAASLLGCTASRKAAVIKPAPNCTEALAGSFNDLSENELSDLLDQTSSETRLESCWIPLMKKGLDDNRDIPHAHLLKAVKVFNKKQHEVYFHKAVYRYLAGLTQTPNRYRMEDRNLLETYCSYLINSAATSKDERLDHAKVLCRKLDRDLYAGLFE